MSTPTRDRYRSFAGLDCDANAGRVMDAIRRHLAAPGGAGKWGEYFTAKMDEQQRLGVDDLFFVGSQMNNIYALLDECADQETRELLYQVEQECC